MQGGGYPRRPIPYPWLRPISYTMGGGIHHCTIFSKKKRSPKFFFVVQNIFSDFGPKKSGVQKLHQKVVFWLKKCEKNRIRYPNFHRTNAVENALCTKKHFFQWKNGKFIFKKIEKFPNFWKFAKLIFGQKKTPPRFFFLGACGFGDFGALFFLYKENEKCTKKAGLCCIP